jgi:hypothetical protein
MKNFWTKNQYKTLEEYLIECVHEKTDFCLSFKEIPNPDFEGRFRQQYANEFLKMESLEQMSDDAGNGADGDNGGDAAEEKKYGMSRKSSKKDSMYKGGEIKDKILHETDTEENPEYREE